ncbi:D-sedoheptulose 7-phosphate isomerase [Roseicella sp. DB1501]|uniref:D-sedoheptulose 7-phosphate isomerase n=1 Tax=Roseicella sp. DB1501 TaxID=2730925 RepID=UPI00149137DC|nr:D-sedoheptulose 7-phosphate isomerase [Roseicella sp. DB1501]NOG72503.1 D-sedoheptulose 7-phosphate isomerase [Roseicella sp. DB1501]
MPAEIRDAILAAAESLRRLAGDAAAVETIEAIAERSVAALAAGRRILLCGNGGSAADAQHWAAELVGRFHYDRPGLPAIALTTDSSILTAIGNDYGYDRVFARQVEALGQPGDLLYALSTSGRSPGILAALRAARERGMGTIGFTGAGGGAMPELCDLCLRVPAEATPRIQEAHEVAGHLICELIERRLFPQAG